MSLVTKLKLKISNTPLFNKLSARKYEKKNFICNIRRNNIKNKLSNYVKLLKNIVICNNFIFIVKLKILIHSDVIIFKLLKNSNKNS